MAEEAALDALRDMFRYHAWATLRLIDFCAGLPLEQLEGSVPGTRGPILDTLRHIVRADYGYKMRFKVHSKPELEDEDVPSLDRMRAIFAREIRDLADAAGPAAGIRHHHPGQSAGRSALAPGAPGSKPVADPGHPSRQRPPNARRHGADAPRNPVSGA